MTALVVGGGFAGLSAALELGARGVPVTLLERRPVLGGRAYSYRDARTGDVVDNGQHVLFGCYRETIRFLERIGSGGRLGGPARLDVPYVERGRTTRLRAARLPHPLDLGIGLLRLGGLSLREKLSILRAVRQIGRLAPHDLAALDALSVERWLGELGQGRETIRRFWEPLGVAALNETLDLASARWMAAVVRGVFLGGRAGSRVLLPGVGLSELYVAQAEQAIERQGGKVRRSAAVEALLVGEGPRVRGLRLRGGEELRAEAVVLAVPHGELRALLPEPWGGIPPFRDLERLGESPIVSVHLWLDREPTPEPFAGLLGTSLQWLFNISRIRGGEPGHLCLVASAARALAGRSREEIEATAVEELGRLFPGARQARVKRAVAVVQPASTISLRPGLAALRPGAATPIAGLALAGDWTDRELPATIEAAVASGRRAAEHLRAGPTGATPPAG